MTKNQIYPGMVAPYIAKKMGKTWVKEEKKQLPQKRLKRKCENCQFYCVRKYQGKLMAWGHCLLSIGEHGLRFGETTLNLCICKRYQQRQGSPFISYGKNTITRGNICLTIKPVKGGLT